MKYRSRTLPWTSTAAARWGCDPSYVGNWKRSRWNRIKVSPSKIILGQEAIALGVVHAEGVLEHGVVLQADLFLLLCTKYSLLFDRGLSSVKGCKLLSWTLSSLIWKVQIKNLNVTELTTAFRRRTGPKLSAPVNASSKLAPIWKMGCLSCIDTKVVILGDWCWPKWRKKKSCLRLIFTSAL